jgi:acyl carrier protein phosphodiesterase
MKTRTSFVANSSSSSFVISKSDLTPEQIEKIKNYYEIAKELCDARDNWIAKYGSEEVLRENLNQCVIEHPYFDYLDKSWQITETDSLINGYTCIDNFDFEAYLAFIGVDLNKAKFTE